jgi:hypothetical protein
MGVSPMSPQTPPGLQPPAGRGWRRAGLGAVKTVHTAAFLAIAASLSYFLYAALARRSDRRAAIAAAIVTAEALVYAANGFRCPLTDVAQRLGDDHPSVADIYLPRWVAAHIPHVTAPMYAAAVALHAKNVLWGSPRHIPAGHAGDERSWPRTHPGGT